MTRSLGLSFLLVTALATQAPAQAMLIDDFNDGNADGWTTFDTTDGRPWGPGTFDASSGTFQLEGAGLVPVRGSGNLFALWDEASDPVFTDGFVRTTIRTAEDGSNAGILFRANPNSTSAYAFFGSTVNNRFRFNAIVNGTNVRFTDMPGGPAFGIDEDWNIEAGAVGDQLSMKVWRAADLEPESPQWTFTDRSLSTGDFGLFTGIDNRFRRPARVSATFDDIYFTIPETPLVGDIDGDGSVAFADFLVLSHNFGIDVEPNTLGDLDGDGNVGFPDFLILSDNFGRTANEAAAVPEPSSAALLGFAALLMGLARHRRNDYTAAG